MKRIVLLATMAFVALAIGGCKKAEDRTAEKLAEKMIEQATGGKADVDISGGKFKITTKEEGKEGSVEFSGGGDVDMSDFPKDLPIYPQAKAASRFKAGPGNQQVMFTSPDKSKDVCQFYQKKLESEGWEIVQDMKMAPAYTLVGKKGKRQASVIIGEGDQGSTISISLAEDQG